MELTSFTKDMYIISKLSDNPNSENNLSAQDLKKKFDEAGVAIQSFINATLIPEIRAGFTECIDEVDALVGGDS